MMWIVLVWGKTMKPTKKRPAKRKLHGDEDYIHDSNPIVGKLLKLKYRINDVYRLIESGEGKPKFDLTMLGDTRIDKDFVVGLIHNIRKRDENPSKIQMEECNKIWSKYEG